MPTAALKIGTKHWKTAYRAVDAKNKQLRAALKLTEFGFNHARCPVCAGWNAGPYGETDKVHTKDCPVAIALKD